MEFTFRLTGTGWAEARIADDASWARLTASYLSDALGSLLEALGVLLEGAEEAVCSWDEEPGEYRWLFIRTDVEVYLRILWLRDQFPPLPDSDGTLVFETRQPLVAVASAVAKGADAVLADHGEAAYLERWVENPFPTELLHLIKARLDAG